MLEVRRIPVPGFQERRISRRNRNKRLSLRVVSIRIPSYICGKRQEYESFFYRVVCLFVPVSVFVLHLPCLCLLALFQIAVSPGGSSYEYLSSEYITVGGGKPASHSEKAVGTKSQGSVKRPFVARSFIFKLIIFSYFRTDNTIPILRLYTERNYERYQDKEPLSHLPLSLLVSTEYLDDGFQLLAQAGGVDAVDDTLDLLTEFGGVDALGHILDGLTQPGGVHAAYDSFH